MEIAAIFVSVVVLLISLWTQIETTTIGVRERRADLVKRVGEAFVAAQACKNMLSNLIDASEKPRSSLSVSMQTAIEETLVRLRSDYATVTELIKGFEGIVIEFELGGKSHLAASVVEAKIARFNQGRVLAEFDFEFVKQLDGAPTA